MLEWLQVKAKEYEQSAPPLPPQNLGRLESWSGGEPFGQDQQFPLSDIEPARSKLPYRPTSDTFLLYKGKLVAQDRGHYIAFPGGGLDPGEDAVVAATRECMEEVGAVLAGELVQKVKIEWDWPKVWADTEKRKRRFNQFRGEAVYLLVGRVDHFVTPTSTENDAWFGDMLMDISDVISILKKCAVENHPNYKPYRAGQIRMLEWLQVKAKEYEAESNKRGHSLHGGDRPSKRAKN